MITRVFERFTDRARQVVVLAQEEARILKHNYLGTEHILLGLLRVEEGIAAETLQELGADADRVRAQVLTVLGASPASEPPPATEGARRSGGPRTGGSESPSEKTSMFTRFTENARLVVELAQDEAAGLEHDHIGTEHILLGLVREGKGVANYVLLDFGADSETTYNEVIRMVSPPGERKRSARGAQGRPERALGHAHRTLGCPPGWGWAVAADARP